MFEFPISAFLTNRNGIVGISPFDIFYPDQRDWGEVGLNGTEV